MIITPEIYAKVKKFAKGFRLGNSLNEQDLVQEVLLKLHLYEAPVEYLNSFIYSTVKNTYLVNCDKAKAMNKYYKAYAFEQEVSTGMDNRNIALNDLNTILESFVDNPKQYATLKFMINNPDMRISDMGPAMGVNFETFKATVHHIKQKIKNEGWV
jgi:DNA-directed RNA polymerase specialized sigma24 family protein